MLAIEKRMPPKDKDNSKRMVVYISDALYEELELLANQDDRSVSNFTRNLILEAIQQIKDNKANVT